MTGDRESSMGRRARRAALVLVAVAASAAVIASSSCQPFAADEGIGSTATPGDGGTSSGDAKSDARTDAGESTDASVPASEDAGDAGDAHTERCLAGGYYCGGAQLVGRADSVYRCEVDGKATLVERCANGCVVNPAGIDDACKPPAPCVVGGAYCGGDKINGDPLVLYRCLAGGMIEVIKRCTTACKLNTGADDTCT
jgi:hypothetical protein